MIGNKPPFVYFVVFGKYDFTAEECDEITFKRGDPILVLEKDEEHNDGWWKGKTADKLIGLFPVDFTTFINIKQIDIDGIFEEISSRKRRGSTQSNISSAKFSIDGSIRNSSDSSINNYSEVSQSPVIGNSNTSLTDENIELYSSPKLKNQQQPEYKNFPPNQWKTENVLDWLDEIGFSACIPLFKDKRITGQILLEQNLASLREIGVSHLKDRLKLFNSIVTLKEQYAKEIGKVNIKDDEKKSKWRTSKYFEEKFNLEEEKKKAQAEKKSKEQKQIIENNPRNISSPINIRPQLNSIVSRENMQLTSTNFNYYRSTRKENARPQSQVSKSSISSISSFFRKLSFSKSSKKANQVFEPIFQQADYQGWLWTRFNKNSKWKKRWIILSKEKVYFLKEPKHPVNIKHTIQLSISFSIQPDIHKGKTKYTFNLIDSANSEITFFSAENHLLMMTWINVLVRATTTAASRLQPCPEGKSPINNSSRNVIACSPGQNGLPNPNYNHNYIYDRSPVPHTQHKYGSSPNQYHYSPIQQQMRASTGQIVYQHPAQPQSQQHLPPPHQQIRTPIQQSMKPTEGRNSMVILQSQQQQQQAQAQPQFINSNRKSPNQQPIKRNESKSPLLSQLSLNPNNKINSTIENSNSSSIKNPIVKTSKMTLPPSQQQQQQQQQQRNSIIIPAHRQMDLNSSKNFYPSPNVTPSQPMSKVVEA